QVRGFFIEERPVLDCPASGSERGDDSGLAVAVGGDDSVRAGRLPDDRLELFARELRMDRMVELARDTARREDLDDPRPDPELHPDAFQALGTPSQRYENPVRRNTSWMKSSGNA